jgi:hypothetical protein
MNLRTSTLALRVAYRFSALLLALLWCAVPVAAGLHADAEAHRFCAEHGALEDGGDAAGGGGATGDRSSVSPLAIQGETEPSQSHHACAFSLVCRFGDVGWKATLAPAGDVAFTLAAPSIAGQPAAPIAVIAVAPKTSPPA